MKQKTKPKQKTLVIEGPEEKMMSYKIFATKQQKHKIPRLMNVLT